jgi:hypothetical protein
MPEDREVTIYDIAKHLNISAATVSRGLKNNPAVKKNTRKKIADTAKQLGYRSNAFASSLRSKETRTLGVLVPRLNSHFMSSVLSGMENTANREGYNLIISQSLEETEKEKANALNMFNKRVDGLLVSLAYNTKDIQPTYAALKQQAVDYDVYLAGEVPARWHYGVSDDLYQRIGDIILVPHAPKSFSFRKHRNSLLGKHGFDNALPEMHATFYAWGPAFKKQLQIDAFENVHVYPLIAHLLGLNITEKIDGSLNVLKPVLVH